MPLMLFSFYRVIRSWRKGRDFFARLEYKQDGIPSCRGCGHKKVVFYDHYYRKAKLASIDGRIYDVNIKARRYRCPKCGRIYREPIRGLKSNKRISESAVFPESKNSGGEVPRYKIGVVSLYGILTRVCMRKPSRPSGFLPTAKSHSRFA